MDLFEKIWFSLFILTLAASMTCALLYDSMYDKIFLITVFFEILIIVLYSVLFKIPTNKP